MWTTEDVAHDQIRIYPAVADSSAIPVTMTSETGRLARVIKQDGTDATFTSEFGFLGHAVGAPKSPEFGRLGRVITTGAAQLTLWIVEGTPTLSGDGELIPIPDAYYMAPVYFALAETYSELGDHRNPDLAAYYTARFGAEVMLARQMFTDLMPYMLVGIGSSTPWGTSGDTTLPSEVISEGVPHTVMWPRHCGADDYDGLYDF
jgi:hypothetical protein